MQLKLKKLSSFGYFLLFGGCLTLMVACGTEPESQPEVEEQEMITPMDPMPTDTIKTDSITDSSGTTRPRDRPTREGQTTTENQDQ